MGPTIREKMELESFKQTPTFTKIIQKLFKTPENSDEEEEEEEEGVGEEIEEDEG